MTTKEKCFACGKPLGKTPVLVDTRDDQLVFVGRECFKLVKAAGDTGYQPKRGPRLFLVNDRHAKKRIVSHGGHENDTYKPCGCGTCNGLRVALGIKPKVAECHV